MIKIIRNKKIQPFIGMKVKIREDLKPNIHYNYVWINESMVEYCGKKTKIRYYDTITKKISLNIDNQWVWTKEMLIPLE